MSELRLISYWSSAETPELPDPATQIDLVWDDDERSAVAVYLGSATLFRTFMGYALCRICGRENGDGEFTDGIYAWPSGLAHYVEEHGVRLPSEFVEHAVARLEAIEAMRPDLSWWIAVTRA